MTGFASIAKRDWDILVIGGGITGAAILREAARSGLRALLVEQNDFAWGTSSRSSKLIHGGLRYLAQGQLGLIRESVSERAHLLEYGPPLVEKTGYLYAVYRRDQISARVFDIALRLYALMHGRWRIHRIVPSLEIPLWAPGLSQAGLTALFEYDESQTDDARLVMRVLREATDRGAVALNYVRATRLIRDQHGYVIGAGLEDRESGQRHEVLARAVVNATGAWADHLRGDLNAPPRLRPVRGSHLVIPGWRLRQGQVVSFFHPRTQRPIFCVPWQGVVLVGTTDVDHEDSFDAEPRASPEEIDILLSGLQGRFPALNLTLADVQAVFAGVRPVTDIGTQDPAKASRDRAVWFESGLLTVTGGKLSTFCIQARSALRKLRGRLNDIPEVRSDAPVLEPLPPLPLNLPISRSMARRWQARYGPESIDFLVSAPVEERSSIWPTSPVSIAEMRWICRKESVHHLDDLILRRVRLGLTVPQGGARLLAKIRPVAQAELDWSDDRWDAESERYTALWEEVHGVPISLSRC